MVRLQKYLANCGVASRRKCETLIQDGKVLVNDKIAGIGDSIDPDRDTVSVNGNKIAKTEFFFYLLNKPPGYLSTVSDPFNRPTIFDLIHAKGRVYPVGRLDQNSEGLMLLTNDGELAYRLTHPQFEIEKVYEVMVDVIPSEESLRRLEKGVELEDGMTAPCKIRIVQKTKGKKSGWLEIKIHEGRKREIRRMLKKLGCRSLILRRTALGPLSLTGIELGKWRPLTESELEQLMKIKASAGRNISDE